VRLNWFSPLPPARTGIAHYTAKLLPELTAAAEVTLWTDQAEWRAGLERLARVRTYATGRVPWDVVNRGDVSFYHLGNNRTFHEAIWRQSRLHPGVVVLHDPRMQDFFGMLYKGGEEPAEYKVAMGRYYGPDGFRAAERFLADALPVEFMTRHFGGSPIVVENALGVVVHSREALEELRRYDRWPVLYAPLPYPASPRAPLETTVAKYASGPPYRLILFGHIGRNRRLESVLRALADLPDRAEFVLDLYGEVAQADAAESLRRGLGLIPHVHFHGYVSDEELTAALDRAHLAINLRYPTMGEASESQLRIWDHALPSLVSQVGWYAQIPDDAVRFVRPEHEVADLRKHLSAFRANPAAFSEIGRRGRRLLEEHHRPTEYTRALFEFAGELSGRRARAVVFRLAERASRELLGYTSPEARESVSRRVAEEVLRMVA
jgi:glycosyltransferase involved in cell wall biosynthesis